MPSFRERFDEMVAALRAHPQIEVYEVVIQPPASPEAIRAAEEVIGMPLPEDMRAFYAAHDGVFLEWGLAGKSYKEKTAPFDHPDYGQPPGCINLLPVSAAFSADWQADSFINEVSREHQALLFGRAPDPEPPVQAVLIDNYAKFHHADLVIGPEPVMLVATDHGADLDSSDFMSFSTYLDVVLSVFGSDRYAAVGCGWSRKPQRIRGWERRATLDEIIAKVRE